MRQSLKLNQAGLRTRQLAARVDAVGQRCRRGLLCALQRRAAARAPLVNQHHVAPVSQADQQTRNRATQVDGTLPWATGKEQHRVGFAVARQRGQYGVVQVDLWTLRLTGVQGPLQHAAPGVVLQPLQAARFQAGSGLGRLAGTHARGHQTRGRYPAHQVHEIHGRHSVAWARASAGAAGQRS